MATKFLILWPQFCDLAISFSLAKVQEDCAMKVSLELQLGKPQCFLLIFKHQEVCFASSLLSFPKWFSRYRGSLLLLAEQYRNGCILRRKQTLVPCDALRRTWAMENMQETYWEGSGLLWGSLLARLSILSKGLLH